jgi:hypothetical protein
MPLFTIGMLCSFGCGQEAKVQFATGNFCCDSMPNQCPAVKKKLKENSWIKGRTKESDPKVAVWAKNISIGKKGKGFSVEHRNSLSLAKKGKTSPKKGLSLIEICGEENAKKVKKKQRIARINAIEERYGQVFPAYNIRACRFFEQFDRDFNTKGQHGTSSGEYYIKELGYWLDYINFGLNLIIEWDEEVHYDVDGNLEMRDVQRQKEIQEHFPDFRFVRIREKFQEEEVDCLLKELRRRK